MTDRVKRGLTYAEAIEYVGIKRRTFDRDWKPKLTAMVQGTSHIYDREDIDRVFDQFKREAANDPVLEQNSDRNGRPTKTKGNFTWAKKRAGSTPPKTGHGTLTSSGEAPDFSSVASQILMTRKGG